jgi:hypothetical protein
MAAGYGFGTLLTLQRSVRRPLLLGLGAILIAAFFAVRYSNVYGDPSPWAKQADPAYTVISFFNCTKYPPSLCYLLMTIGPAIFLIGLFDQPLGPLARPLIVFGRVPLFFYLLHIPLIHGGMVLTDYIRFGGSPQATDGPWAMFNKDISIPPNYGVNLPTVYLLWVVCVVILYFPCRWFADVKRRRKDWWLRYL